MLFAATAFIVLEFLVNTILEAREIYPRSVNVDLETVFSFKENEKPQNIKLLDRVQNFISDVKEKVEGNYRSNGVTSGRRHLMLEAKGETTFVDLIIELIEVLKSFKDDDLQDAFAIADDEIKKYHYKGCKFHELMSNQDIRKFLRKIELLKTLPGHIIRERLDRFSALLKSHSSIINYINSMYKADDVEEFKYLLRYFKGYQNGIEDTNELIDLVRDTVRRMLFDHYSSMNINTRRALKAKIEALLWKDAERTQNVQHLEWTIEYTAPTPDDFRALRETTTTKRDISNNMNLNFQMENQFEFHSVEKVKTKPNKKYKNDKKIKRVPKQQTENESTDKTSSLEFNLDSEDHSESKDETIGVTVDWGDKNEQSSDASSVEDITTKKYHKKYKYTTPFYMEQASKEYKPRKQKIKGFTNGNIGRSHNKPKDTLRDSFSQDISFANKKKHHRKHTSKSTTDITTIAYKTKKPHAGHHSKASNKKKEKYIPKTRDVIGPKRENHKFSMHSYLKTVHFDGKELTLKLAESESENDDKTALRMPQEKKSPIVIIQKPQTTKSLYTTTQKRGSVTPTYEESSDDSSHESEEITKVTKEPVVKHDRKTEKERESSSESKPESELENNIQNNISKATKNISVRKHHEKSSEESENQNLSNDISKSPLRMSKTKHKLKKTTKTQIDTSSTNSESAKENSEIDETLLTGKQPIRFDEMSHVEENSSNRSESTKTTIKSVNERAQHKKSDDSTTSSESEVEKSLNEETYINSINERGITKQTEKTRSVSQTTAGLVTDKNPNSLYDESQDSSESNEISTKDFKMAPMQKTYETKSPKEVYQPLSAELNGETKTNQNAQKQENIGNTQGAGQYSKNIVIEKATEQILTKENPVEEQISGSTSSDEKQLSTEDESLDNNVKHAAERNINLKTETPTDNIQNSEEKKDNSQETTNLSSNEFEMTTDQSFNQKWSDKKTMTNQASINQQLQSNNDNHRSRKQNEVLNSPVPETLTTIKHTNIFNYGNMTKEVIKKKILDVMRKRNQMINEYNDPHMPLNLMQNYGIDKKSDEMGDAQLSNAYNEDQESFNSHFNQKLMAKIQQYRVRKSNMNMEPAVIKKQTTYKEANKLYHDNRMEQHINNNVHLLKEHDNAFKYKKPQYLEKVEYPDEYYVIGKVNKNSLEQNVSNEKKSRRSIHNNKSIQQDKKEPIEISNLQEEVMQTSERNLRRNEYEHGSSAELFQNLSDMKKHLNNNKYSKFNPNTFISTEFTETANRQLKPAEFEHDNNFLEQKNGDYLSEKSATTMSVYETQENNKALIYTSTSIPNYEQTVENFERQEKDNVEDMSPIQQESTNTFERISETTTTYEDNQVTQTMEPIEKVISNMEVSDIIEKQSWILDHKGNITETDKATTASFIPMSTYNITENPNIDLNKTTRSYILLSDFIKSQPVKLDLDNEITRSKEPQNRNQDFRRHKMGNRAKMKQLQQLYKTMYPMETTKTETLSTTKVKPTITTRVTTTSPSTELTTTEAITDSIDTALLSSTKEDPREVQTVLRPEFATLVRTHLSSTEESSTTTEKNTRSTKKKRRRRTRRRRTSTTISNNTEPDKSSVRTELTVTTIENTKSSPEYSVATDIGTIHTTEPTSTYTENTKTSSPITADTENIKELLKIDLESSETTPNPEIIPELTETSKPITTPDNSKETIKTTNKSVDTEYRKSNTIDVKKDKTPITIDTTEYHKSNTVEDMENTPAKEDFTPEDDYNLLLQRANDNNTYADVTDMDYHAIPLKNDTNRRERLEMIEKLNLQPEENDTEFGLKDAIALADSVKPQHNLETELRVEKSRLLLNKDMLRLYGHTISAMTFPSTLPSNTLYTDPFDPLMPGGLDLGLGLI